MCWCGERVQYSLMMNLEDAPPVRFRLVLELTFPDADRWDPSNYSDLLEGVKKTLETATTINCKELVIRKSEAIGPGDNYEDWRGGPRYDFSSFSPRAGYILGTTYPVPIVETADLRRVWELLSEAEAGELKKEVNVLIAVGQTLRPESDAQAVIWRTYLLRALQAKKLVPAGALEDVFERAASTPIEHPIVQESDLESLAHSFSA
jgi:hypothetical protein